jgi:ATP-dependent RNA helicase RhlE
VTTFQELGLDPLLLKALETEGYTTPTPIQAQAIPTILQGKDLLGIAQTGTGKTAAFALPILQRLNANRQPPLRKGVRSLILSPTRELATQIAESFRTYGRHMGFSVAVVFGGVAHKPQRDALARGVDVLVATPGRLLDHMGERNVTLEGTEILVLDEADQMMDLGFIRPLRQIVATLSHRRQSLFFSATMPHEIGALAAELLKNPVKVSVSPVAKTADRVTQEVIFIEQTKKRALLVELFANQDLTRTIVFTRTKRGADRVARHLESNGVPVSAIHGNKSQAQRDQAMKGFKAGKIRALIATDIAARGIDVDAVSHVINYEIPNVPESYVHRIGRTARAGAEGIAISLVDNEERAYLRDIERLTRLTIPSTDRRNDATLVAPVESRAERDAERADLSPGGSRGQRQGRSFGGQRGSGQHGSDRGADRRDGSGGRPQRARHDDRAPSTETRGGERGGFHPLAAGERALTGEGRGPDRRDAHRSNRDRPQNARADERRGERSDRGGEGRPVQRYNDRTADARPQGERSFGERPRGEGRGPRSDDTRAPRGDRPHREHSPRDGDRRPHGAEGRPRHANGHRDGEHRSGEARTGERPANGHASARPAHRGQRSEGPAKGLEGVKFLNNRGERPQGRPSSAPRGDDRRKAPRNA